MNYLKFFLFPKPRSSICLSRFVARWITNHILLFVCILLYCSLYADSGPGDGGSNDWYINAERWTLNSRRATWKCCYSKMQTTDIPHFFLSAPLFVYAIFGLAIDYLYLLYLPRLKKLDERGSGADWGLASFTIQEKKGTVLPWISF